MKRTMYIISILISGIYGFFILMIFDTVNNNVNFTPIFKYPSWEGAIKGVVSLIIYFILIFIVNKYAYRITKKETLIFIFINMLVFIFFLILFIWIGVIFFVETPNYA